MKSSECRPDQIAEATRAILTGDGVLEKEIADALANIAAASSTDAAWRQAKQLFAHYQYDQVEIDDELLGRGIEPDFE